jgi:hypothetical protein
MKRSIEPQIHKAKHRLSLVVPNPCLTLIANTPLLTGLPLCAAALA